MSPWDVGIPLRSNAGQCYPMAVQGLGTHGKGGGGIWLLLSVDLAGSLGYLGKGVTRHGMWVIRVLLINGLCSEQHTVKMVTADSQGGFLWCLPPKG